MGKLSPGFAITANQFYPTWDRRAGRALVPYIEPGARYCEPCAGAADLINQLTGHGLTCAAAYDIAPQAPGIQTRDALDLTREDLCGASCIITNPPWGRDLLHRMIRHFVALCPTWLLFDASWAFSKQSQKFMRFCSCVVPIGKLRWEKGTAQDHKQNSAWYYFEDFTEKETVFQTIRDNGGPFESERERRARVNSQLKREIGLA